MRFPMEIRFIKPDAHCNCSAAHGSPGPCEETCASNGGRLSGIMSLNELMGAISHIANICPKGTRITFVL